MPIDRPSGGHDDQGDQEARRTSDRSVDPQTADDAPARRRWLDIDSASDEDLIAFLGLDRTDRAPAGEGASSSDRRLEARDDLQERDQGLDATRGQGNPESSEEARPDQLGVGDRRTADKPGEGLQLSAEQLDEARAWLADNHPSPSDNPGKGFKTWGVWLDDQGGSGVESSRDDERSLMAQERLTELGLPAKSELRHHVETKLAAAMAQTDVQHVAVVINHQVCQGPLSCDTWLPKIIKEGGSVRVYQHDGTEAFYRGEAQ